MSCPHGGQGAALPPDVDPLSADAFRAFKRVMHLNRQLLTRTHSGHGAHPAQTGCLMTLLHHPDVTQRDLAERLHIAPATLTTMLQRMERQGSIERYADAQDQRLSRVRLTPLGQEQVRELASTHGDYINTVLGGLTDEDRKELTRLLTLIGNRVEEELGR